MMSPHHSRFRTSAIAFSTALLVWVLCAASLSAQVTITGVVIQGVGSFIDARQFPRVTVRFRATRNNQPLTTLVTEDVYVQESNRFLRITTLTSDGNGIWRAEFTASTFSPKINVFPTQLDGGASLYGLER